MINVVKFYFYPHIDVVDKPINKCCMQTEHRYSADVWSTFMKSLNAVYNTSLLEFLGLAMVLCCSFVMFIV